MNDDENDDDYHLYKILLLGDSCVGKSCILLRYCDNSFQEAHLTTIGLDFRIKSLTAEDNRKIKIQIWDTAGQDRFRAITRNYYKGANGILLIFDVTDKRSYEHVREWVERIKEESPPGTIVYLIGNKIDQIDKRVIDYEQGKKLAEEFKVPYYETSAKFGDGINEVFQNLVNVIHANYMDEHKELKETKIVNLDYKKKTRRCCK